jgi:hypothetical protein
MIPVPSEIVAMRKGGVISAVVVLAITACGVCYWSGWRKSDSALSFLRLRVNDLRGRVEKQRAPRP